MSESKELPSREPMKRSWTRRICTLGMEPLIKGKASAFLATERLAFVFLTMTFTLSLQTLNRYFQPIADYLFNLCLIAVTIKRV